MNARLADDAFDEVLALQVGRGLCRRRGVSASSARRVAYGSRRPGGRWRSVGSAAASDSCLGFCRGCAGGGDSRRTGDAIQIDDGGAHLWTFAGGRINYTLKYAFEWLGGWKAVADNYELRIEGDGVSHATVGEVLRKLREPGFWEDPQTEQELRQRLPEYRLSKFQKVLPERASAEMVGGYLLDVGATTKWLATRKAAASVAE